MLGLEVKDYVIGGIAVAGAGMGVANTVMNITTKRKIKKINESLDTLEAAANNSAAELAALKERLAANGIVEVVSVQQPKPNQQETPTTQNTQQAQPTQTEAKTESKK